MTTDYDAEHPLALTADEHLEVQLLEMFHDDVSVDDAERIVVARRDDVLTPELDPHGLASIGIIDDAKLDALTQSMHEWGWVGAPLVLWWDQGQCLTGRHRHLAALAAQVDLVPCVDLVDICTEYGVDLWESVQAHGGTLSVSLSSVALRLPDFVVDAYGMDWQ